MGSKFIGIEIGNDTIKLALYKKGILTKMAVQAMPDNLVHEGVPTSSEVLSSFIKKMMKKHKIRAKECAFVIPPQRVVSLRLSLPYMNDQKLRMNLPFEFRDYIGTEFEQYDYDYIVLGIQDQTMDLYAAACKKNFVETYYEIFKRAGTTLKVAMPSEMAWLNLVSKRKKELPSQIAIADLGLHRARVNIFANGDFAMGKDIDYAGQMLDESIAGILAVDPLVARRKKEENQDEILNADYMQEPYAAIALEIMKTINFYNFSRSSDDPLTDLYFCGGTAQIEPLREMIARTTGLKLHHVGELLGLEDTDLRQPLSLVCAQAAGAAIQLI